jgi:hypothetical protein
MHALRETQEQFAAALLWGSEKGRIQVYRNNVFASLTGALADVFPVVKRLVGEAFFRQMARRFVRCLPSRSGNLHDFGRELPIFLATLPETAGLRYLPDVASLEWAWHEVFHEAEALAFDFTQVTAPETARLRLHPAVRLLGSRYPILDIWEANQDEDVRTVDLDSGGAWLAVMRRGLTRYIEPLSPGEFALLREVQKRSPFGEACEAVIRAEPALELAAAMSRLVRLAVFSQGASS